MEAELVVLLMEDVDVYVNGDGKILVVYAIMSLIVTYISNIMC